MKFRYGTTWERELAEAWCWEHDLARSWAGDIIAYRVVNEARKSVSLREEFKTFIENRCRLAMENDDWETAYKLFEFYERL